MEFGLDDGGTPVTTMAGLSRLVRQMLFVGGICHSHMPPGPWDLIRRQTGVALGLETLLA